MYIYTHISLSLSFSLSLFVYEYIYIYILLPIHYCPFLLPQCYIELHCLQSNPFGPCSPSASLRTMPMGLQW